MSKNYNNNQKSWNNKRNWNKNNSKKPNGNQDQTAKQAQSTTSHQQPSQGMVKMQNGSSYQKQTKYFTKTSLQQVIGIIALLLQNFGQKLKDSYDEYAALAVVDEIEQFLDKLIGKHTVGSIKFSTGNPRKFSPWDNIYYQLPSGLIIYLDKKNIYLAHKAYVEDDRDKAKAEGCIRVLENCYFSNYGQLVKTIGLGLTVNGYITKEINKLFTGIKFFSQDTNSNGKKGKNNQPQQLANNTTSGLYSPVPEYIRGNEVIVDLVCNENVIDYILDGDPVNKIVKLS